MEKKKKILFIGLGTAATGILGFFGWEWWKEQQDKKQQEQQMNSGGNAHSSSDSAKSHSSYHAPSSSGSSDFPLHKGSRGARVKAFQQALIAKYGSSVLPKYGADGDFGNEVAAALQKEGLPSTIDESTYNAMVGGGSSGGNVSSGFDASGIANSLYNAVQNSDFTTSLGILRKINDTTQYATVDAVYKTLSPTFGVRKTIVTGVLDAFTDNGQTQQINSEFIRMGLKNNNGKWSLSGFEEHPLVIADENTTAFEKDGSTHAVKAGDILGYPYAIKEGWVYFYPVNAPVLLKVKQQKVTIHKPNN